jgi:uncharacterized membrane protein YeiB
MPQIRRARWYALGGIVLGALALLYLNRIWPGPTRPADSWLEFLKNTPRATVGLIPFWLLCWSMSTVAATTLVLAAHNPRWAPRLNGLAAAGRMPLTTYLSQSVVCTLLFYGYGLALTERFTYFGKFVLTVTLFAAQMVFASWWFTRYRFGPVEWLWRTISYGRQQPMVA